MKLTYTFKRYTSNGRGDYDTQTLGVYHADSDEEAKSMASLDGITVGDGVNFTRTYEVEADGSKFVVQSTYGDNEFRLVVDIVRGRAFAVGTEENPTLDDAVRSARRTCAALEARYGEPVEFTIKEEILPEVHWAQIGRTQKECDDAFPISVTDPWYLVDGER
jgi:hypothetical protein